MTARRAVVRLLGGALVLGLTLPLLLVSLLSLSRTAGLEFYADPAEASFRWWRDMVVTPEWATALVTSLSAALISVLISLCVALPLAAMWRLVRDRAALAVLGLSALVLLLPPVVVALGMARLADAAGLFDTLMWLGLAHATISLPVVATILVSRFEARSTRSYATARALGARPAGAALTWLFADHRGTIAGAAAAGILTSMSEATITLFVTDTRVATIAREALSGLTQDMKPTTFAAFTAWLVLVATAAAALERILEGRRFQ